jgi:hypothetical protein
MAPAERDYDFRCRPLTSFLVNAALFVRSAFRRIEGPPAELNAECGVRGAPFDVIVGLSYHRIHERGGKAHGPRPLQSTRTGQAMRRPACRSSKSCSWSSVAAARYSSQIAWTRAGSRSASMYAARTSEPNAFAGDPQPPRASSTTASGAADTSLSGSGSGCASSDHGQKAVASFLSARSQVSAVGDVLAAVGLDAND